ncbi:hypothetical protein DRE_04776 [Drechslerella stenobrocha 248]|uniref:Uncharacterized protein n=1 Tax=Drechslerella stenobrocha 248 TaxID=1043628 RepID=W7I1A5_9PEZI|nr:hypothetical protein DRE_04776 [Drechslerella stenobrocha 248]
MEHESDILILVHNTATTNARADAQYRDQALAHLQFAGVRVSLDDIDATECETRARGSYVPLKRPRLSHLDDDALDEHSERRKRASFVREEPQVQVGGSPEYCPMSSFGGLSQTPLAYSISTAIPRSMMPELSTFVCEPITTIPSQYAFTLEPVTPQVPNISVVPETILRPSTPTSQLSLLGEQSSIPIEYDSSPLEVPDSQATPPKRQLAPSSSSRGIFSDPADDSTVTHVSQSPPMLATAVVVANDTSVASLVEISPLAPSQKPVTPTRRIIQVYPPPPTLASLSPVSPLEPYSLPETFTSPDKLPLRFPSFTGQPVSPRSLLAYILEKDLNVADKNICTDRKQINRYLELRQIKEYNITSPPPSVNSNPRQVTPMMQRVYSNAKLDKYFRPKIFAREMRRRERGYWRIDLSRWPRSTAPITGDNGAKSAALTSVGREKESVKGTAEKKYDFWNRLAGYVKDGNMGETRMFFESESEGAGDNVGDILRLYCWGEVAVHVWVILYAISDRIVSELALRWVDAGGHVVIDM